jgi:hypothetical protein
MASQPHSRLFNPNGCLTAYAIRTYLDAGLHLSSKVEIEKHIRQCRMCSEAVEGFRSQYNGKMLGSDMEFLSGKIRRRYAASRFNNRSLPVMIAFAIIISFLLLIIILFMIRLFLL